MSKKCKRISSGKYDYGNYIITNHGYYAPDQRIWWEAVNKETGCADYHATTKKQIIQQINEEEILVHIL